MLHTDATATNDIIILIEENVALVLIIIVMFSVLFLSALHAASLIVLKSNIIYY